MVHEMFTVNSVPIETEISDLNKIFITILKVFYKNKKKSFNTGAIITLLISYFKEVWKVKNWKFI